MVFGLVSGIVENALDIGEAILSGEGPTKKNVAKLVDDGFSIAVIAMGFGVAEDVIEKLLKGDDDDG
ncbi:MAG: hypothetical protein HRU18_25810 [Pseudoalteromonas sp.]|uniref:hypothetical protein n=1 Tax=Pseudoalteromonas sp. TaxID=53249 RepID=UPI001D8FEA67|nr:hypothetical protein [Pseudoalteromonas sp.]NRA81629.1 hypothetical protein [Pseudoalteromonas sp.]